MSKRKELPRKSAQTKSKAQMRKRDKANRKIVVTIKGEMYDRLERIANAMNSVSWCSGNTAESVFKWFVWIPDLLETHAICCTILGGIATGDNGMTAPEPINTERLKELEAAFDKIL